MSDETPQLTIDNLNAAEAVAGLSFTPEERELMLDGVQERLVEYAKLRAIPIDNSVPPALRFDPRLPGITLTPGPSPKGRGESGRPLPLGEGWGEGLSGREGLPSDEEQIAFAPLTALAHWVRTRQITSTTLTELYLERLKRHDPVLQCVVTLTEERARRQAQQADAEIEAGRYRGPLHGIPWGCKDLLAVAGYPTTWGAPPYKDQTIDQDAEVVRRLDAAGAVLVAKLAVGSLAWGDVWWGGVCKNPWNTEEGSSGSSAGSGAAVAAGLVGFAIGTETQGSIVSPSTRCGVTGLRPTFGRVSRQGAMALAWSMDKIGPMCRAAEDCALVLQAIYGPDGQDLSVADVPFSYDPAVHLSGLKVGYLAEAFEGEASDQDRQALATVRALGVEPIPISLPAIPTEAMAIILSVEAAAAFDELTRSDRDDLLVRQGKDGWPNKFRQARLVPAVEYIQANRLRTLAMQAMTRLMERVDLYLTPSLHRDNMRLTNLTGHPAIAFPSGFSEKGAPTSISFIGRLYDEGTLIAAARDFQAHTDYHTRHPRLSA